MPRPLRIEFENAWYHVMNRGANRQAIFKSTSHRNHFYTLLSEISDRFKIEIHAFCLMNNHYHLLIKTPYANLGRAMRHLNGIYTQRFNKLAKRDGPLFRGRYKAILVDSDHYLLQVSRYIHLNPVVAKICRDPADYKWSSYRVYANTKLSISWLITHFTLNQMTSVNKVVAYISYVNQGIDEKTRKFYGKEHISSIYGEKYFIDKHLNNINEKNLPTVAPDIRRTKLLLTKDEIINTVINYFQISQNELYISTQGKQNVFKLISIYLLCQHAQLKHKEISAIFTSLKAVSISAQIWRFKKMMFSDKKIMGYVIELTNMLTKHGA